MDGEFVLFVVGFCVEEEGFRAFDRIMSEKTKAKIGGAFVSSFWNIIGSCELEEFGVSHIVEIWSWDWFGVFDNVNE